MSDNGHLVAGPSIANMEQAKRRRQPGGCFPPISVGIGIFAMFVA